MPSLETTVMVVFWVLYPIPTLVAWLRHDRNAPAITALDYLGGWTIIGWVAALVWAFKGSRRPVTENEGNPGPIGELVAALIAWAVAAAALYFVFNFMAIAGGGTETFPGWLDRSFVGGYVILVWVPAVLVIRGTIQKWKHGRNPMPLARPQVPRPPESGAGYCPSCGQPHDAEALFCAWCGVRLPEADRTAAATPEAPVGGWEDQAHSVPPVR
jgi:hypothetical protein